MPLVEPREPSEEEIEAMARLASGDIAMRIDMLTAFYLLGFLQLGLRHPEASGPARQRMTGIAWGLRDQIVSREPTLNTIADAGWRGVPTARQN